MPFIMNFGLDPKGFATEFTASFSLYLFGGKSRYQSTAPWAPWSN